MPFHRHSGESRNPFAGAMRGIAKAGFRIARRITLEANRPFGPQLVRNDEAFGERLKQLPA